MSFGMVLERGCQRIWRPGQDSGRDIRLDLFCLLGLGLLLMGVRYRPARSLACR